ncbi:hypothetical protein CMQ_4457 [Grosmannia clavigera kw1407]|uniref:Phytanoyl-dioxygenase family protein n=1 Tax=Grosmannia clavigera (strain kw1407 / UAMH 11150) TaxID=655863 RepID=F0XUC7_GROCL|nr:uncharacterized protein CMQ_4457 [Grosmannia clavigera kw1407]EFW98605.1 hypothetical protein CMQ_4457 [Grosmannia clavigera kw1407]
MASVPILTAAEKEHFVSQGWLKIPKAFTRQQATEVTKDVWIRLGMSSTDKGTWNKERTHMPSLATFDCSEFAPRAWAAICEVSGGEERVTSGSRQWRDSMIVNLGTVSGENKPVRPQDLNGWHIDGDFFVHFLDSPEQGLLVIPLFTDIVPGGGGTVLCPEALPHIAQWLHDHPDGVSPQMAARDGPNFSAKGNRLSLKELAVRSNNFVEATGECGDVYLLHPMMLHSASTNPLRNVRIITNPPVSLRQPFCFDRSESTGSGYSLVELATMRALGKKSLPGWKITVPRERIVPERVKVQERMKQEELRRLGGSRPVT